MKFNKKTKLIQLIHVGKTQLGGERSIGLEFHQFQFTLVETFLLVRT